MFLKTQDTDCKAQSGNNHSCIITTFEVSVFNKLVHDFFNSVPFDRACDAASLSPFKLQQSWIPWLPGL